MTPSPQAQEQKLEAIKARLDLHKLQLDEVRDALISKNLTMGADTALAANTAVLITESIPWLLSEAERYRKALEEIARYDVPFELDSTRFLHCREVAAHALDPSSPTPL